MNTNRLIAFEMRDNNAASISSAIQGGPWARPKPESSFLDLAIKPEFHGRKMRFKEGDNWIRVVPALAGSKFEWMMAIQAINFEGGRFAHPKTLTPGAKSVFDLAYGWSKVNAPTGLYCKANKEGVRLLSDPQSLCWVIAEEDSKPVARLLIASGYNGSRGGTAGLGFRVWKEIIEHDTSKSPVPDAIHPDTGLRILVNKQTIKGNPRPVYTVRVGRQPSPILPILNEMESTEISALVPLENVVRTLTVDEEWECLGKVMAPRTAERIRAEVAVAA